MRTFFISIDDFSVIGHAKDTLKSLYEGNKNPIILVTQAQSKKFKSTIPKSCKLIECLPDVNGALEIPSPILGERIAKVLLENKIGSKDLIVLKMPFPHFLLSVVCAISLSEISSNLPRISVLMSQTDYGFQGHTTLYTDVFSIIDNLPKKKSSRFVFLHEREILRQFWQKQFPALKTGLCGYVTEWIKQIGPKAATDQYNLMYIGEAREDKGFELLSAMIKTKILRNKNIKVHCDSNPVHANSVSNKKAIKRLKSDAKNNPRVKLINQRKNNNYSEAFTSENVALLLYSKEYQYRGSGIIQECVAAGMYIIAFDDLNFQLDYPNNVITVKRSKNLRNITREVLKAIDEIEANKGKSPRPIVFKASDFRKQLSRFH